MSPKALKGSLYLARCISAFVFFLIVAKANVWVNTSNNTVLVLGYRFFILLAPFFLLVGRKNMTAFAFLLSAFGLGLWLMHVFLVGTILISLGIAVGGYVLKFHASKTPNGAAGNKIALNIGSSLAGLAVAISPLTEKNLLIMACLLMLVAAFSGLATRKVIIPNADEHYHTSNFSFRVFFTVKGLAWALVGFAFGIKIIAVFSVLPQYLIDMYGMLPKWYGYAVFLNGLVVILFQMHIMKFVKRFTLYQALIPMILGMIIIGMPSIFFVQFVWGTVLWSLVLSILECAVTYLDTLSANDGCLLIKETFFGVGSAFTVFIMRDVRAQEAAFLVGLSGLLAVLVSATIFEARRRRIL